MRKIKIAITGANGFLGKHLIKALDKKDNLELIIFNKDKNNLFDSLSLESFLKGSHVVVHLAGSNRDSDFGLIKTNTLGTMGLLEAVARYSPKAKVIFSSSFQVYDEKSAYGLSKKLAENILEFFSRIYGIRSIILRISNIYGKDGKAFYNSVIATFVYLIKNKKPIVINGTGEQKRDYVYVGDVISAIIKAIYYKQTQPYEDFNICSGKLTTVNEIVNMLRKNVDYKVDVNCNSDAVESNAVLLKDYSKTEKILNWHPEVDMAKGLSLTIKEK